jgi:hypothetical protein
MADYRGMTVNERLVAAGLLNAFDAAARSRNKSNMIDILLQVQLDANQAEETVKAILNDPAKYGLS